MVVVSNLLSVQIYMGSDVVGILRTSRLKRVDLK